MHKAAIIGSHESVIGFKAVGIDAFPCDSAEEATRILHRIAKEDYVIIYITEGHARDMLDAMELYKTRKLPAVVPIPGRSGSYGVGMGKLKKSVKRAIGVDILFKEKST